MRVVRAPLSGLQGDRRRYRDQPCDRARHDGGVEAMTDKPESPITFEAPSFVLFDEDKNAVLMTQWGSLAIFNVRAVAEQHARQSARRIKVIPVSITPVTQQ